MRFWPAPGSPLKIVIVAPEAVPQARMLGSGRPSSVPLLVWQSLAWGDEVGVSGRVISRLLPAREGRLSVTVSDLARERQRSCETGRMHRTRCLLSLRFVCCVAWQELARCLAWPVVVVCCGRSLASSQPLNCNTSLTTKCGLHILSSMALACTERSLNTLCAAT